MWTLAQHSCIMHVCICVLHLLCRVSCSERQYGWHIVMCVISSHHFSTDGDLLEAWESQFGCRAHSKKKILFFTSRHVAPTRYVPTFTFPFFFPHQYKTLSTLWWQRENRILKILHRVRNYHIYVRLEAPFAVITASVGAQNTWCDTLCTPGFEDLLPVYSADPLSRCMGPIERVCLGSGCGSSLATQGHSQPCP